MKKYRLSIKKNNTIEYCKQNKLNFKSVHSGKTAKMKLLAEGKYFKSNITERLDKVPDNIKGGQIVFSPDVNVSPEGASLFSKIKSYVPNMLRRFGAKGKVKEYLDANTGGYSLGNFFTGRYIDEKDNVYDEKSLSLDLLYLDTESLMKVAEDIRSMFNQDSVLVFNRNDNSIGFLYGDDEKEVVKEAGANINRLKQHLNDNVPFVIGTAYRGCYSNNVNRMRNKEFIENYVKPLGLAFIQIKGKYQETGSENVSEERSFFIMGNPDGSDDEKLTEVATVLVADSCPEVQDDPAKELEICSILPYGDDIKGYKQDSVCMKLSNDDMIYLYDKKGRIQEDYANLGELFEKQTDEEIYSTIKNNDFAIKKIDATTMKLISFKTDTEIKLKNNPNGVAGHLLYKGQINSLLD